MQAMHQDDDNVHFIDRRKSDRVLELVLKQLETFGDKLDTHIVNSAERHDALGAKITGNDALIKALFEGFPDKDPRGHHDYHIEVIAEVKRRKEFWSKMLAELVKYGLLGFIGWLFTLAWAAAVKGPK